MEVCVEEIFDELKNSVELLKEIVERLNNRQPLNINNIAYTYILNEPKLEDLDKIDMASIRILLSKLSYYLNDLELLTIDKD